MSHATMHPTTDDVAAAVKRLRHDRLRYDRCKLRLHAMITDVEGVLAETLTSTRHQGTGLVVTGLDAIQR